MKIELSLIKDNLEDYKRRRDNGEWLHGGPYVSAHDMEVLISVAEAAHTVSCIEATGILPDFLPLAEALSGIDFNPELPDWILEMRGLKPRSDSETAIRINENTVRVRNKDYPYPRIGDDIVIPTTLYLSHGADDFAGGQCKIVEIFDTIDDAGSNALGFNRLSVRVAEKPASRHNWFVLIDDLEKNTERYGNSRGRPDPDLRPEFNKWD